VSFDQQKGVDQLKRESVFKRRKEEGFETGKRANITLRAASSR